MWFSTTFIPTTDKEGMDMERQAVNFNSIYPERGVVG